MQGEPDNSSSPELFSKLFPKWLITCLDYGISERDFWNMTIAELGRLIESKQRVAKREAQEQATQNYILADLIGRSVARLYSASNRYPEISEVYPTLFDDSEIKEKRKEQKAELSALRLKLFAESFNKRHKEGSNN